jgi:hypothetical protein
MESNQTPPQGAELHARRTAAAAVLADFNRELHTAPLSSPPPMGTWALRLSWALESLLESGQADDDIRGSRTASGTDPGGVTTIVPADLGVVLGALADAATFHEERATSWCVTCRDHPANLCEEHAADLDAVARYRSLGRALGDDRA